MENIEAQNKNLIGHRHACVVDAEGAYVEFVLVDVYEQDGIEAYTPQYYEMNEGETLVFTAPPPFIRPVWNGEAWAEAATEEEIAAWDAEHMPSAEELEQQARAKRDRLLAETDWTQVLDAPIDAATREAYRVYRQALRDVPEQEGFPQTIVWPELPAVGKAEPDPVDTAVDVLLGGEEE